MIVLGLLTLCAIWFGVCCYAHSYANTVDHLAFLLHQHAVEVREMHKRRSAVVNERWVKSLEVE